MSPELGGAGAEATGVVTRRSQHFVEAASALIRNRMRLRALREAPLQVPVQAALCIATSANSALRTITTKIGVRTCAYATEKLLCDGSALFLARGVSPFN